METMTSDESIGSKIAHGLSEGDTVSVKTEGRETTHEFDNLTVVDAADVVGETSEVVCETGDGTGVALYARVLDVGEMHVDYDLYAVLLDSDGKELGEVTELEA